MKMEAEARHKRQVLSCMQLYSQAKWHAKQLHATLRCFGVMPERAVILAVTHATGSTENCMQICAPQTARRIALRCPRGLWPLLLCLLHQGLQSSFLHVSRRVYANLPL